MTTSINAARTTTAPWRSSLLRFDKIMLMTTPLVWLLTLMEPDIVERTDRQHSCLSLRRPGHGRRLYPRSRCLYWRKAPATGQGIVSRHMRILLQDIDADLILVRAAKAWLHRQAERNPPFSLTASLFGGSSGADSRLPLTTMIRTSSSSRQDEQLTRDELLIPLRKLYLRIGRQAKQNGLGSAAILHGQQ